MLVVDQMGRSVEISDFPQRIVSIVPSQTELIADLQAEDRLIGVTRFCIHPKGLKQRVVNVGGTKDLKIDLIRQLQPDLIIGNKEENSQSDIELLEKEFPVWMSDISTLEDALQMIRMLGELLDKKLEAGQLCSDIRKGFSDLEPVSEPLAAAYFIWKNPWMAVGPETFVDDMLKRCGLINAITSPRYPEISPAETKADVILLSSEPFPFAGKHLEELQQQLPDQKIMLVDGEYFSWYGSRLTGAPNYFQSVIDRLQAND